MAPAPLIQAARAEDTTNVQRFGGSTRYETAVEISNKNWSEAYNVVLARGDDFPDALAGAVLANSPEVSGPLLLNDPKSLRSEVLAELKNLRTNRVYVLGGQGAVSETVVQELKANSIDVTRIDGSNRYDTAAKIAKTALSSSQKAYVVSGSNYADALSISSYAAAQQIPLLLTAKDSVPAETLEALQALGVSQVTLVGGEGVISPASAGQLESAGFTVSRLAGEDRYLTNAQVLKSLDFDLDNLVVATGASFPDALAGSVLAAKHDGPILLVPQNDKQIPSQITDYLNTNRSGLKNIFILGGWGVINYKVAGVVVSGSATSRISLHFWDGYGSVQNYREELNLVPGNVVDYINVLSPNYAGSLKDDGSFGYRDPLTVYDAQNITALGQSKGARVTPLVLGSGTQVDKILASAAYRQNFIDSAVKMLSQTKADGIVVNLEILAPASKDGLTTLMKDLYAKLHPLNKLVLISVMPRTSETAEPWLKAFDYAAISPYTDYVQIMTYDKHYSTSAPGPIAPLDWMRSVLSYAVQQIPREKILMGVPYYGRAWTGNEQDGYTSLSLSWNKAVNEIAAAKGITISRETTATDPVGVPTFSYTDDEGKVRKVYFDDAQSWNEKLKLLDQFQIGGVAPWSMLWANEGSAQVIYPLIKQSLKAE